MYLWAGLPYVALFLLLAWWWRRRRQLHRQRALAARTPARSPSRHQPQTSAGGGAYRLGTETVAIAPKRYYTPREVIKHASRDSLWLIIDRRVYDVTNYIDNHPGGEAIMRNAGRDSTAGFHGDQHPDKVHEMLPEFYIGELDDSEEGNG
ncbi:hypothetical protein CDCA_CDCA09G2660 [Cyanidium caldarium]|uniref:Cytochrome b5 heme-binding domain-containing protein n=1 Tax=Cyanidium caldarium TaxID=2771 RepID=A0AAV9IWZ5_CYACA|nr:hypothetical protein CDCA_CDCA09G2660 [Cyanidium caldarium]